MTSPFLTRPLSDWLTSNALAFALHDAYPVSPGHTLVIPKRLIASWFDATPEEQHALLALVTEVKHLLDSRQPKPDGYNIGINVNPAAGQTVPHLHIHVIPRYLGDVDDPRGGLRHVIPGKGNYLTQRPEPLVTGGDDPFLRHLAPLWSHAHDVAIVAAFIQETGLHLLRDHVFAALDRDARVRLVTGDYLGITQAYALEMLLDWAAQHPGLETRVVETAALGTSFHPKSWRFEGPGLAAAFVGSSNISGAALREGVEWNLRVDRHLDQHAYARVVAAFEARWSRARPIDAAWVASYAQRARTAPPALPPGEEDAAPLPPAPEAHELQVEALDALAESRAQGRTRALVVLATGLGKTLLAALDVAALATERRVRPRVLLLAHREELLEQAARTFRQVLRPLFPGLRVGWFVGDRGDLDGDLVLASVLKLARPEHLERLAPDAFDYVIVDEVHHAAAASCRRILDRLAPGFLLGLTATPERADGGDVLGLFDDHVAYRADLGEGVARELLVPFAYQGLKDDVDYASIPWRSGRFAPEELEAAVETQARMDRLWRAWQEHTGTRTLVFCCSIRHAQFTSRWLEEHGVRAAAVYAGDGSHDRVTALDELREGKLDALCAVDLFNEGVDVPDVDRVVMLRPTESSIVFLQQLGRGLRRADGKQQLTVIDFVGNHRVFLERVRTLLNLAGRGTTLASFLAGASPDLPPGCSVDVELEAKDLLRRLLPTSGIEIERAFRELLEARGQRPTAGELHRMGYRLSTLQTPWFEWLRDLRVPTDPPSDATRSALGDAEAGVLAAASAWLEELEHTRLTKSFKMVTLEALLGADALESGLPLADLSRRCRAILLRSPELLRDVEGVQELGDPGTADEARFQRYWRGNPVEAWTGTRWFAVESDRFVPRLPRVDDPAALAAMTRELVDLRLAQYRARFDAAPTDSSFTSRVLWNRRDPILKLPREGRPSGETDVRLPDGSAWTFRFMKEFCNVARPVGTSANRLPDLLRGWFGISAGKPGTAFQVRFTRAPDGWWVEPMGAQVLELPPRDRLVAYPTLRAAAGSIGGDRQAVAEADEVELPFRGDRARVFAVRAHGRSMDGGKEPIRDGDWLVMELARGAALSSIEGRVALVQTGEGDDDLAYQVKRVVREGGRFVLRSDNPELPPLPAARSVPVARLVSVIRPESLTPPPGPVDLARAFGFPVPEATGRHGGHLFAFARAGDFPEPDRLRLDVERRPGETAYVVLPGPRYHGVARWLEAESLWEIPELDFATWRELGSGRSASRRLPEGFAEKAQALVDELAGRAEVAGLRIVGRSPKGGLRVAGSFRERTVSLIDIAWVLVARERFAVVDEAAVNRVRYLDGTPKESTRWIDTGIAIRLVEATRP